MLLRLKKVPGRLLSFSTYDVVSCAVIARNDNPIYSGLLAFMHSDFKVYLVVFKAYFYGVLHEKTNTHHLGTKN